MTDLPLYFYQTTHHMPIPEIEHVTLYLPPHLKSVINGLSREILITHLNMADEYHLR